MPLFAQLSLYSLIIALLFVGSLAATLSILPRLGVVGQAVSDVFCRAPFLDVVVALLTWVPPAALAILFGWPGFLGSIVGQMIAMGAWCLLHELAYRQHAKGPRIVTFINRIVGRPANHAALWVTAIVLPVFWGIRLGELFVYPMLVWLLNFPRYKQSEWVNVSRHKFDGLVGHDLIWCLYCDWMTGVYSLGAEMLRNVESFWCPIRFYDGKKCENCKVDFPDIEGGWVQSTGNMADVVNTMEKKYATGQREWFGHPARLTVKGKDVE